MSADKITISSLFLLSGTSGAICQRDDRLGFTAIIGFVAYLTIFDTPYRSELACSRQMNSCFVQQLTVAHSRPPWAVPLSSLTDAQVRIFPARRGAPRISLYLVADAQSYTLPTMVVEPMPRMTPLRSADILRAQKKSPSIIEDDRITFYAIGFGFIIFLGLLIALWTVLLRVALQPESRPAVDTQPAAS